MESYSREYISSGNSQLRTGIYLGAKNSLIRPTANISTAKRSRLIKQLDHQNQTALFCERFSIFNEPFANNCTMQSRENRAKKGVQSRRVIRIMKNDNEKIYPNGISTTCCEMVYKMRLLNFYAFYDNSTKRKIYAHIYRRHEKYAFTNFHRVYQRQHSSAKLS